MRPIRYSVKKELDRDGKVVYNIYENNNIVDSRPTYEQAVRCKNNYIKIMR